MHAFPPPRLLSLRKWFNLLLLALAELLAMTLWFSASAVAPQLTELWHLGNAGQSWLTMSVQLGFVAGALLSAIFNLADHFPARRLFALCALGGAGANLLIPVTAPGAGPTLLLRFLTGATLAGVYPPGMKLMATWCREDRGLGIGILVGALTIGSATPHLLNALLPAAGEMPAWQPVLSGASAMAALAAMIVAGLVREGPFLGRPAPFDWHFAARGLTDRASRLANFGYLGHMWELYAMWAWVPVMLGGSYRAASWSPHAAGAAGFATIAVGAAGCVLAGRFADRIGRTTVTAWSMAVSGSCALIAGLVFRHPGLLTLVCLIWGFAVVADSAQFSAAVSELADSRYVGTALTVQTCLGFLLTLVSIRLVPLLLEAFGWRWAFAFLAIGPAFGIWSMLRLRRLPEAVKMASGNR